MPIPLNGIGRVLCNESYKIIRKTNIRFVQHKSENKLYLNTFNFFPR